TSPMSAARPRPSRDRLASSAMAASPEFVVTPLTAPSILVVVRPRMPPPRSITRGATVSCRRGVQPITGAQLLLALDDFGREPQIGFAADTFEVIDQHRLAIGRRFRHPHVARNDGAVDLGSHLLAHV